MLSRRVNSYLASSGALAGSDIKVTADRDVVILDGVVADEEAKRRRRARMLGETGDDRLTDGLGDLNTDLDGAAGIDMGYGGEGTDVKPSR